MWIASQASQARKPESFDAARQLAHRLPRPIVAKLPLSR